MNTKKHSDFANRTIASTGLYAFDENMVFQVQNRTCPPHTSNLSDNTVVKIDYLLEDIKQWSLILKDNAETIFLHEYITSEFNACQGFREKKLYLQRVPPLNKQFSEMKLEDNAIISRYTETSHRIDDSTLRQKNSFFWEYNTKTHYVFPAKQFHIATELIHTRRAGAEPDVIKTLMNIDCKEHSEDEILDWLNAVSSSPNVVLGIDIGDIQPAPDFDKLAAA